MFKEQQRPQLKRLNSTSLSPNSDRQISDHRLDIVPPPSTNSRKIPFFNFQRLTQMPSNITIERCCFLLIHLLFYVIILTIVYIRLDQFTHKQEKLLLALRANDNITLHKEIQRRLLNYNHVMHSENNLDCSCPIFSHPKRNRSTRCLQIRVGFHDVIENVFCQNENSPQWLTIQNRESNAIDFNRTWSEYRRGFGNVLNQTDFWIGNENLHRLTTTYPCRLKIELTDWYNETRIATYETFRIADQRDGYRIHLSAYRGDIEPASKVDSKSCFSSKGNDLTAETNAMLRVGFSRWHQNARFSTWDHYATSTNCPRKHAGGGWWYHSGADCAHVQLNGRFATHSDGLVPLNTGILWIGWKSDRHYSFQRVNMAIQTKSRIMARH